MLLAPMLGRGQGWERVYNFGGRDIGTDILETQDDNFVALTWHEPTLSSRLATLTKTDREGQVLWQTSIQMGWAAPITLDERPDGGLIMMCNAYDAQNRSVTVLHFLSASGVYLHEKQVDINPVFVDARALDAEWKGDTLVLVGWAMFPTIGQVTFLTKTDPDGNVLDNQIFSYAPSGAATEEFSQVEHDADGNFWVTHRYIEASGKQRFRLMKLSSTGSKVKKIIPLRDNGLVGRYPMVVLDSSVVVAAEINNYPTSIFCFIQQFNLAGDSLKLLEINLPSMLDYPNLCKMQNGGVALLTQQYPFWPQKNQTDIGCLAFDQHLNPLWSRTFFRHKENQARTATALSDGGLLIVGTTTKSTATEDLYLIRTDSLGNSITNLIAGQVQWDQDKDCIEQPTDPGLKNWIVTAASPADTFYRNTAPDGSYALRVDTGHYTVRVRPLNSLWDTDCSVLETTLTQFFDTIQHNFPVRATVDCPGMEVSTAVARLRPCLPANLQVWWCNNGTINTQDAQIQVVLNEHMTYDSASLPPAQVSGDTLWFALGDVEPFECGNFFVRVQVDCDTTLLGQTLCYTAHAYPDTTCLPPSEWSGAQVVTYGYCEGDSVRLVLRNIGSAATAQGLEYIIVEDNVIMMQVPFWLPPSDSIILKIKANGSTWRLIAQQEPNFPHGFFSTVALEGCHEGATFSTGFVNQFPSDDAAPWLDEECRMVTGSYDPNDKSAVPEGYTEQHFVAANTDLEYLIRFQNTGTDTAFRVVIYDQISPNLDPASVRPGAASHPYTWSLTGTGELAFTFDPIALPDSGANLAASQGFVQFRIAQRPNLPPNTRFENRAAIYFDFNAPVITNTVFHTVQPLFKQTSGVASPVFAKGEKLKVWPNPATEVAYISFKDKALSPRKLSLYDLSGRLVAVSFSSESTVAVQRSGLPSGAYWLSVEERGERTQGGVVAWR